MAATTNAPAATRRCCVCRTYPACAPNPWCHLCDADPLTSIRWLRHYTGRPSTDGWEAPLQPPARFADRATCALCNARPLPDGAASCDVCWDKAVAYASYAKHDAMPHLDLNDAPVARCVHCRGFISVDTPYTLTCAACAHRGERKRRRKESRGTQAVALALQRAPSPVRA